MKFINQEHIISSVNSAGYVRSSKLANLYGNFENFLQIIGNDDFKLEVDYKIDSIYWFRNISRLGVHSPITGYCFRNNKYDLGLYIHSRNYGRYLCYFHKGSNLKFILRSKVYNFEITRSNKYVNDIFYINNVAITVISYV